MVGHNNQLSFVNQSFKVTEGIPLVSEITQIVNSASGELRVLSSGNINPHEGAHGALHRVDRENGQLISILEGLRRPVQMLEQGELVFVSQFGFRTGGLSVHSASKLDSFTYIHQLPGSYRIKSMNLSYQSDNQLVTSISQGYEGVYLIDADNEKMLLNPLVRFEPEFGLSDMDIGDINGDGRDDLVIVNGDNADYSLMPKEYHGIKVYLNLGGNKFDESFSYPMHGSTQVKILDINNDSKLDIIASAYFAADPQDGVLILINDSEENMSFRPYRLTESNMGRWLVMETMDIDNDDDMDVVFGSYMRGPMTNFDNGGEVSPDLLLLINTFGD